MDATLVAYPAHRESDVALRDGSTVHIRPLRPDDAAGLRDFFTGLSETSRYYRFFSGAVDLGHVVERSLDLDYHDRFGLVAIGPAGRIVAHATYLRTGTDTAEVAFAIADDWQGFGIGTILLGQLAESAHEAGIALFEGRILPQNRRMIEVFRESGFPVELKTESGEVVVHQPTSLSPEALERFERRDRIAAQAALHSFLQPTSVAVIGASRSRGTIGGEVFHNLLAAGFNGPVYPVNPKAEVVQSVIAFPSVTDIPGPVEMAVVVVPAAFVLNAVRECGAKGVRSLVVISSGFAEVGDDGRALQRELVALCREYGMRLIGPNCMGILNANPAVGLNATFAPHMPPAGRVAFLSQSGALGLAVIDYAGSLGLGLSSFVSVGNKADISGNDLLQYWEEDPDTDVILFYLESFGNPRRFARISRRVGMTKPIVAVKSGRSQAGARATSSHTGAMLAASDATVDALFQQAGVIRTDTLSQLFDVASLLANQPAPRGDRVGIVTNAGGLGILCADACEGAGLHVPPTPPEVREELSTFLAAEASLGNPIDMIASATPADYARTIELMARSGGVDALVVLFVPPLITRADEVASSIREVAGRLPEDVPLLTCFMSAQGVPAELRGEGIGIPSYRFPEDAAHALARAVEYARWRARPQGEIPRLEGIREDDARELVVRALERNESWLDPGEVAELLACYGIPMAEWRLVDSPRAAGRAAREIAGPVALKAVAPKLVHKTEARAVRLGLQGPTGVERAAAEMRSEVAAAGFEVERFLVQRMVGSGVELLVGVAHDRSFGPVIACGMGGTAVELVKDLAVRITPLTDVDAAEMLRSLRTYPLLTGYRGAPAADVAAVEDILLRVSAMVEALPEVAEMDCNPVIATPDGAVVVDARIRLESPVRPLPLAARRP